MLEVDAVQCRERVVCRGEDDVFARISTALLIRFGSPFGQCLHNPYGRRCEYLEDKMGCLLIVQKMKQSIYLMVNVVYMVLNVCVKMSYIVSDCGVEEIDGSDVELFNKGFLVF